MHSDAKMRVVTWNARGLRHSGDDLTHILTTIHTRHGELPHVLVLTEVKLKTVPSWLRAALKGYHVFRSLLGGARRAQAGVVLAIRKDVPMLGKAEVVRLPASITGFMVQVDITLPDSAPLSIVGMYCPHTLPARQHIYAEFAKLNSRTQEQRRTLLVAGDFNATLWDTDRATGTTYAGDRHHRGFAQDHNLSPVDTPSGGRAYTFRAGRGERMLSRIDDVLTNAPLAAESRVETIDMTGRTSDHDALAASVPFTSLGVLPPLPEPEQTDGNMRMAPLTAATREATRLALLEHQAQAYANLERTTADVVERHVRPHWEALKGQPARQPKQRKLQIGDKDAREVVDELGQQLSELLQESRRLMEEVCPKRPDNVRGLHYRPRKESRNRARLVRQLKAAAAALHKLRTGEGRVLPPTGAEEEVERKADAYEEDHACSTREEALLAVREALRRQRNKIDREHTRISEQEEARRFRDLMETNQKTGNKIAMGRHKPTPPVALRAIKKEDGELATSKKAVLEATAQWARRKLTAPEPNGKTGRYLPHEAPRQYPWEADPDFSQYKGLIEETIPEEPCNWMHAAIDDKVAFQACLKTLSRGKAPGPDGVANELLQALPPEGKRALHNIIRIMWAAGLTPSSWKTSETVMLFKHKGTPLELDYYRRIGLENTVYKVWTRMVTFAMADVAERYNMLSASQAGFRNKRSTAHQVELMISTLEDAYWFKQNIYLCPAGR